ncbi:MAG: HAD family hydrolase [Anaerolineae bacterium]|nr:HAD family hydrolase [Anaerolineae bacterium]
MPYQAVMFDLDGTLLDTLEDIAAAANRTLDSQGFPTHPVAAYRYFLGGGARPLMERALPEGHRDTATLEHCLALYLADVTQNWKTRTRLYAGIPEMLSALVQRNLKLSILTNKLHTLALECVAEFLSDWPFEIVLGQRDDMPRKPDPTGALEIITRLNIPPADFLYLGDTPVDMKTATAAGVFPVGVLWGFREAPELRETGAQALIAHPLDVLDLL